jgi:hypothetical protein
MQLTNEPLDMETNQYTGKPIALMILITIVLGLVTWGLTSFFMNLINLIVK